MPSNTSGQGQIEMSKHTACRKLVELFFLRLKDPEVKAKIEGLIACFLKQMLAGGDASLIPVSSFCKI